MRVHRPGKQGQLRKKSGVKRGGAAGPGRVPGRAAGTDANAADRIGATLRRSSSRRTAGRAAGRAAGKFVRRPGKKSPGRLAGKPTGRMAGSRYGSGSGPSAGAIADRTHAARSRRYPGTSAGRDGGKSGWLPPMLRGKLSVIITACNEEATLRAVLKEAERLKPEEIIVVLNGCTDSSFRRARECGEAIVVHCPDSAGHDVGRAIGAKLSRGDILLFLDGDMPIAAPALFPFAAAVDRGADVALNDLNPLLPVFGKCDNVTRCKLFLNMALGREDLGAASMTAVPHSLSRRTLDLVGPAALSVPPKAQAAAVLAKLRVENAGTVNVIKRNRIRRGNTGAGNVMEQLIVGDHAEALGEVLARGGAGSPWQEQGPDSRRRLAVWRNGV